MLLEGDVGDRKSLELRVAGASATEVVVVELGEAGRKLPAPRTRHDHERFFRGDIFVRPVSVVADDGVDGRRIFTLGS